MEADTEAAHSVYSLPFCSSYSWILKMEEVYSSETLINFYQTTWHHILEDSMLHRHYCWNLKSQANLSVTGLAV
jgi:hypothetical protein